MLKAEWFNINSKEDFEKYYPIVKQWWENWKWEPVSPIVLPQNGIIIKDEKTNEYICAGWLWITDSAMCVIDLIISNKKYKNKINRKKALIKLIETLESIAKKLEFKAIFTCVKNQSLLNILISLDFAEKGKKDENMTAFIKTI